MLLTPSNLVPKVIDSCRSLVMAPWAVTADSTRSLQPHLSTLSRRILPSPTVYALVHSGIQGSFTRAVGGRLLGLLVHALPVVAASPIYVLAFTTLLSRTWTAWRPE